MRLAVTASMLVLFSGWAVADDRQTSTSQEGSQSAQQPSQDASQSAAQTPESPQKSLKELLGQGFEIKAVTLVPHDVVTRGGSTSDIDAVMIIIQKGGDLANCYVAFSSFADGSYYNGSAPVCTVLK
jgi:hypothetical protein